jgi:diaminopimelate decarboxylase
MHHFRYAGTNLHCESVDLAAVARLHGTPTYVYSRATMEDNFRRLSGALDGLDHRVCYAMKANSNLAVLSVFARAVAVGNGGAGRRTGRRAFDRSARRGPHGDGARSEAHGRGG